MLVKVMIMGTSTRLKRQRWMQLVSTLAHVGRSLPIICGRDVKRGRDRGRAQIYEAKVEVKAYALSSRPRPRTGIWVRGQFLEVEAKAKGKDKVT